MVMPSSPDAPQPLGRVVNALKGWVGRLGAIWVDAQIIELRKRAGAVTHFLTLRDRHAEISATVTCSTLILDQAGPLIEGSQVTALLRPRVWEKTSSLTFECQELRICGEGRLLAQLEQRKRLLQAEGLFDPRRRKRLPFLPRKIGLIAGEGSDAERDVRTNVARRWPGARFRFLSSPVQGPKAAASIMQALQVLDADPEVDVIIITRGGGSLEDLLPFSDEGLVRAVAACRTPVISAVGHEADQPILDLVADYRASTPTAAAARVVPDATDEAELIQRGRDRIRLAISHKLTRLQQDLSQARSRPSMRDPMGAFAVHHQQLAHSKYRMATAIDRYISDEQLRLSHALSSVRSMSPKATLERGYSILITTEGKTVSSADQVDRGDQLRAQLALGGLTVQVTGCEPGEAPPAQHPMNIDLPRSSGERN